MICSGKPCWISKVFLGQIIMPLGHICTRLVPHMTKSGPVANQQQTPGIKTRDIRETQNVSLTYLYGAPPSCSSRRTDGLTLAKTRRARDGHLRGVGRSHQLHRGVRHRASPLQGTQTRRRAVSHQRWTARCDGRSGALGATHLGHQARCTSAHSSPSGAQHRVGR